MLFRRVTDLDLAPLVVLEVAASNVLGCVSPLRQPAEPVPLHARRLHARAFFASPGPVGRRGRGRDRPRRPAARSAPCVSRRLRRPASSVDPVRAGACLGLLAAEVAALFGALDFRGSARPGRGRRRRAARTAPPRDRLLARLRLRLPFRRSRRPRARTVVRRARPRARLRPPGAGLVLSGALLSQLVSNVPAAMLLAPAAAGRRAFARSSTASMPAGAGRRSPRSPTSSAPSSSCGKEGGPRSFWKTFFLPFRRAPLRPVLVAASPLARLG